MSTNDSEALWQASRDGDASLVAQLLSKQKIDVAFRGAGESTALHEAVEGKHIECVRTLLSHGAPVNAIDRTNFTPLHLAAYNGSGADIIKLLTNANADVDAHNKEQQTPLHLAALRGDAVAVRALLDAGASQTVDVNSKQ